MTINTNVLYLHNTYAALFTWIINYKQARHNVHSFEALVWQSWNAAHTRYSNGGKQLKLPSNMLNMNTFQFVMHFACSHSSFRALLTRWRVWAASALTPTSIYSRPLRVRLSPIGFLFYIPYDRIYCLIFRATHELRCHLSLHFHSHQSKRISMSLAVGSAQKLIKKDFAVHIRGQIIIFIEHAGWQP